MLSDVGKVDYDEFTEMIQQIIYCHYAFILEDLLNLKISLKKKNGYITSLGTKKIYN